MKKNLLSMMILALVLMNTVMNAVIIFAVLPAAKKTDSLVTKICSLVDLELESEEEATGKVDIANIEVYDIADKLTVNLAKGNDGAAHYAVASVSISMNSKDPDYEQYKDAVATKESLIKSKVIEIISSRTIEEAQGNAEGVQTEILTALQEMFDSKFIIDVAFRDIIFQ